MSKMSICNHDRASGLRRGYDLIGRPSLTPSFVASKPLSDSVLRFTLVLLIYS